MTTRSHGASQIQKSTFSVPFSLLNPLLPHDGKVQSGCDTNHRSVHTDTPSHTSSASSHTNTQAGSISDVTKNIFVLKKNEKNGKKKRAKQTDMKLACGLLTQIVHVLSLTRVKVHVAGRGFFVFFLSFFCHLGFKSESAPICHLTETEKLFYKALTSSRAHECV